ncbi:MAG TPA: hypothetical protein VFA18_15860 [Gemmataceae bacterium]|nr:hypothetical protein [Gemmataceae bacterium]
MRLSLSLLTAAMLAGAPVFAGDYPTVPSSTTPQVIQVSSSDDAPPSPPTFRERLRNFFRPHRNAAPSQPAMPRLAPVPSNSTGLISTTPQALTRSKDLEGVGHEKDYSWITGRLSRMPGDSSRLMIRYAGADEMDTYGGQMILAPNPELKKYHEGDLVCVYGKVSSRLGSSKNGPGAVYQTTQVYLIPASVGSH